MQNCIITDCGRPAKTRGLCKACYGAAAHSIEKGKVPSWTFLEENGLALPATGAPKARFTDALNDTLSRLSSKKAADITQDGTGNHQ